MNSYEDILIEADSPELITREKPLQAHKGRIKENQLTRYHEDLINLRLQ